MHGVAAVMLGVTGLLALVTLLVPIAARANIAFSIVLAMAGVVLGLILPQAHMLGVLGPVGDFLEALGHFNLSSEAFILLFLPVLLFETAIAVDVRRLAEDIGSILMLAVVAVLISTFVVGFALAQVSDIGIIACLLLAAIVSTTDPIAVVGIFRDLGVPHRLGLLVEGESLFNDAAAISLFVLFMGMATGQREADVGLASLAFLRGFAGGLAFGFACGRLVCASFSLLRGQPTAEITLSVASAYLVFLAGEHYLAVSGVVAVVTCALIVGYEGRTRVSEETWTSLLGVWRQIGYWASSLIFLLATMRVPEMLSGMSWGDLLALAVLVLSAMAARALVLFGFLPGLSALGWSQPVPTPLRAVIVWGGLRGAISLALALAVVENPDVPEQTKHFVSVLCTGFVLFTLFVNAPLLRPLIRLLGLDRLSPADLTMRSRAMAVAVAEVRDRITANAKNYGIEATSAARLADTFAQRLGEAETGMATTRPGNADDECRTALMMLTEAEQALYLRQYQDGKISGALSRILQSHAAILQDGVKIEGTAGYRRTCETFLGFSRWFRLALLLHSRLGIQRPLANAVTTRFEVLLTIRTALRKLSSHTDKTLARIISRDAIEQAKTVIAERQDAIEQALSALQLQYKDFAESLRLQYLERAAIRVEETEYARLRAESVISHEVHGDLMTDLNARKQLLAQRPHIDLQLDPQQLVRRVPLFESLTEQQLSRLATLLRPRLAVPGELIIRKDEPGTFMFFVASGAVEIRAGRMVLQRGSGDFFGEMALLSRSRRNADVKALGFCSLLTLDARDFSALLNSSPEIRERIEQTSNERAASISES